MLTYIFKRILLMIPTLLFVSVAIFAIINAAPGNPGQALNSSGSERADQSGRRLIERMAVTPRRLIGQRAPSVADGSEINAVLFNPAAVTKVERSFLKSRSLNTPFLGRELQGRVEMVMLGEKVLHAAG